MGKQHLACLARLLLPASLKAHLPPPLTAHGQGRQHGLRAELHHLELQEEEEDEGDEAWRQASEMAYASGFGHGASRYIYTHIVCMCLMHICLDCI
jgi:hypothetical protein